MLLFRKIFILENNSLYPDELFFSFIEAANIRFLRLQTSFINIFYLKMLFIHVGKVVSSEQQMLIKW